jgi:hypothetical protein
MEGESVEFKCLDLYVSQMDMDNIKDKNNVQIVVDDNSVLFVFDDGSKLVLTSVKMEYSFGKTIVELNTFENIKISDIYLQSDDSILIEVELPYSDCIAFNVDRESFTISYNDTLLKMKEEPNGWYGAKLGKLLDIVNNIIYLDDGTSVNFKNVICCENYKKYLKIGKKVCIVANGPRINVMVDNNIIMTGVCAKSDITLYIGG